jgi:DinB superfamily
MPTLVANDLEQARQYFAATRKRVEEATAGLSDTQLRFKPGPDRWSIAEILEHMVIVHERVLTRILGQLPQAPAPAPDRDSQFLDAVVIQKIPDRSFKAKAPDFIQPTGGMPVLAALDAIFRNHERLLGILETTPGLRDHVLESPPLRVVTNGAYETMDGYQWVLTAAGHDERHVRQILELKEDPNYPAAA